MEKSRTYHVTTFKVVASLFNSVATMVLCIPGLIINVSIAERDTIISGVIVCLLLLIVLWGYGFFPIYLCWRYYRHDKGVKIIINYEAKILYYIANGVTQEVTFEEIARIKCYQRFFIALWYQRIVLRHGEALVITSLLITNMSKALPGIYIENIDTLKLVPPVRWHM